MTHNEQILIEALETANDTIKYLYVYAAQARSDVLANRPAKFIGLDDLDDVRLTGKHIDKVIAGVRGQR